MKTSFVVVFLILAFCFIISGYAGAPEGCPVMEAPTDDGTYTYITYKEDSPGDEIVFRDECIGYDYNHHPYKITFESGTITINKDAFNNYNKLITLTFGASTTVKKISTGAFVNCNNLKQVSIKGNAKYIYSGAFDGCKDLTTLEIPSSCTDLENPCFSCGSLSSITITSSSSVNYVADNGVVFTNDRKKLVAFPSGRNTAYVIPEGTEDIDRYAFSYSRVNSVTIPASLEYWSFGFDHCDNLKQFKVNGNEYFYATSDGVLCLRNDNGEELIMKYPCGKAGDYVVPSNIQAIYEKAFYGSSALTSLTIPESVISIFTFAIMDCPNLERITFLGSSSLGDSGCGTDIVHNCPRVSSICVTSNFGDSSFCSVPVQFNCEAGSSSVSSQHSSSSGEITCGDDFIWDLDDRGQLTIGYSATAISSVVNYLNCYIPESKINSVKSLLMNDFSKGPYVIDSPMFEDAEGLENVTINGDVIRFGDYAFAGCTNLKSFTYNGAYDTFCGSNVFSRSSKLEYVCVSEGYHYPEFCGMQVKRDCNSHSSAHSSAPPAHSSKSPENPVVSSGSISRIAASVIAVSFILTLL